MTRPVACVGAGQTHFTKTSEAGSYVSLLHEATASALEAAGITIDDVDAIVLALAPEALMGVNHAERWCVEAVGAVGKPLVRIQTGGATGMSAVHVGFDHIASGLFDRVLLVGADRVAESGDAQQIFNKIWDPIYERAYAHTTISLIAMSAGRYMHLYGMTEDDMARVSVKGHANAMRNPFAHIRREVTVEEVLASRYLAWPIKLLDACPQSAGGCAVVLSAGDAIDHSVQQAAWISGIGMANDTYFVGDRVGPKAIFDYGDGGALEVAAQRAYETARITKPAEEVDLVETYASFTPVEMHNAEALGLCNRGEAPALLQDGYFDLDGEVPLNPSGGVICTNPISVTAMVRFAEAALQIQGRADQRQVSDVSVAVATGSGGSHQFFPVTVLTDEPRGLSER